MSLRDSPRWCGHCGTYADHHTDRCPERLSNTEAEVFVESAPDGGVAMTLLLMALGCAAVLLCAWLLTRDPNPCPDGWRERTTPSAVQCFNPTYDRPRTSVHSPEQQPRR